MPQDSSNDHRGPSLVKTTKKPITCLKVWPYSTRESVCRNLVGRATLVLRTHFNYDLTKGKEKKCEGRQEKKKKNIGK